jgi:5-hydroxyisourate hydrolase
MRESRLVMLLLAGSFGLCGAGFLVANSFADNAIGVKANAVSKLSTHVLNTATGQPAAGMTVVLQRQAGTDWQELGRSETDRGGRVNDLYLGRKELPAGTYRLVFETGKYFKTQGTATFFPRVEILFATEKSGEHYHIPLLISPFGYSTYRGS